MPDPDPEYDATTSMLGRRLAMFANMLLAVYAISVLSHILPPRLLDPLWQLNAASIVLDNATIPLVGIGLCFLATYLDPLNGNLRARSRLFSRLALPAALGFLLLIPLQGFAGWKAYTTSSGVQASQLQRAYRSLEQLNQAVTTAESAEELQQAVREIGGVSLDGLNAAVPLQQLKARLRETVTVSRARIQQGAKATKPTFLTAVLQQVGRGMLLALAYAVGFSAATTNRRGDCSLLEQILLPWILKRQRHFRHYSTSNQPPRISASNWADEAPRREGRKSSMSDIPPPDVVDSEYFHHLSRSDDTKTP